jgi:RHS repeat-associated protein
VVATAPEPILDTAAALSRQRTPVLTLGTHSAATETRVINYNAMQGVRISRDPLKNAELRQGPNLYGYVLNNPINLIDAFGLDWSTAAQAIWNAAGYAVSGSEIPGAAAAAPDAARILIIAQFKKACEDCLEKAINDGTYCPKSCPICDEYKKVQAALGGD